MSKFSLILLLTSLTLIACGGKSGNETIPYAVAIQDKSQSDFSGKDVKSLRFTDPEAQITSKDPQCQNQNATGYRAIDSRITPQSIFEKKVLASLSGTKLQEYTFASTILSKDAGSYSRKDDYEIPGTQRSDQVTCTLNGSKGPWLNCVDEKLNKAKKPSPPQSLHHCHVAWSHSANNNNNTSLQVMTLPLFGRKVTAFRETTEHDGLLTCDNKPIGPGKTVNVSVYTYDIPSLSKDSCSPAEIYFFHQMTDSAGHPYQNNSEEMMNYTLPQTPPTAFTDPHNS